MEDDKQQHELLAALTELLAGYEEYGEPQLRTDGDIMIPLDPELKRRRKSRSNLADAFSQMMQDDIGPRRSSTWVK